MKEIVNLPEEVWKPVKGLEGLYEVSNMGRVKSLGRDIIRRDGSRKVFSPKILKPYPANNMKHLKVDLRNEQGNRSVRWVHRIVAEAFIPNVGNKPYIDHIDTDPSNNRCDNLRWVTASENSKNPISLERTIKSALKYGKIIRDDIKKSFELGIDSKFKGIMPSDPKPVMAIDDNGNIVKKYPSAAEAAREFGLHYDAIASICRGNKNSRPGGFTWRYID